MPVFIAALIGALVQAAGSLVGRVLLSLGIGYFVFTGVDTSISWAKDFVISRISATSAQTVLAAGALKLGTCISILTSALLARMTLNGLQSGTIKRMALK